MNTQTIYLTSTKYFSGLSAAISCAHSGILCTGVNKPLISISISIKNHMTNMACCNVAE